MALKRRDFVCSKTGTQLERPLMRVIANDKTRHADLAWDAAAWIHPQLTAAERRALQQAQRHALLALERLTPSACPQPP